MTVPGSKSVRFVLGLAVRIDELEDGRRSSRQLDARRVARGPGNVRFVEPQLPEVDALANKLGNALQPDAVRQTRLGHR